MSFFAFGITLPPQLMICLAKTSSEKPTNTKTLLRMRLQILAGFDGDGFDGDLGDLARALFDRRIVFVFRILPTLIRVAYDITFAPSLIACLVVGWALKDSSITTTKLISFVTCDTTWPPQSAISFSIKSSLKPMNKKVFLRLSEIHSLEGDALDGALFCWLLRVGVADLVGLRETTGVGDRTDLEEAGEGDAFTERVGEDCEEGDSGLWNGDFFFRGYVLLEFLGPLFFLGGPFLGGARPSFLASLPSDLMHFSVAGLNTFPTEHLALAADGALPMRKPDGASL